MKSTYLALGMFGMALFGLWAGFGGAQPTIQAAELRQVTSTAVHGNLAVYFIQGDEEIDSRKVVTLQEALDKGWARVDETGNVNSLVVENLSADSDLFLQSGDMIKGGRQDRMIAADTLVSPGSGKVSLAVHCVEAGRWVGRGGEAATHFVKSDGYAVGNPLKTANHAGAQQQVWATVKGNQDKLNETLQTTVNAAASPTSFQLTLENPKVQANVGEYETVLLEACRNRSRVVGVVFAVNGKVTSAEVYGSAKLFQKAWPKLLRAAAVEAIAERATASDPPSAMDVERFLVEAREPRVSTDIPSNTSIIINREEAVSSVIVDGVTLNSFCRSVPDSNAPTPLGFNPTSMAGGPGRGRASFANDNSPTSSPLSNNSRTSTPPQQGRLNINCVENASSLMYESRDSSKQNAVIHQTLIKK